MLQAQRHICNVTEYVMNIAAFKVSHRWHLCAEPGMPERGKRESSRSGRWQLQCDGAANQDCGRTRCFEPVCLTRRTPRLLDYFLCNICQSMCVDGMFHDLSCASIRCDDAFSPPVDIFSTQLIQNYLQPTEPQHPDLYQEHSSHQRPTTH